MPSRRALTASPPQPEAAQDKYLELAPEPLHIDEWWVDPRTRAALETSVGLGDHVTFTADQTRPFQLTRSQVPVRGRAQMWPQMPPMPHSIRTGRRRCDTVGAWTRLCSAAGPNMSGINAGLFNS